MAKVYFMPHTEVLLPVPEKLHNLTFDNNKVFRALVNQTQLARPFDSCSSHGTYTVWYASMHCMPCYLPAVHPASRDLLPETRGLFC